jgi:hypothetical protein
MRSCVNRLRDLAQGMGKDVTLWKAQEGPLLPVERKKYLEAAYDVIAGTDEAARVLKAALGRLEKLAREVGGIP